MTKEKYKYNSETLTYDKIPENFFEKYFENFLGKFIAYAFGIISAFIGIYSYFQDNNIDLVYEIQAETNVIDFNEDLSKLKILYDETDLKETNKNLKIYSVKIINKGNQSIDNYSVDKNTPLGIKIKSGIIIEKPEILYSSSEYIQNQLSIKDLNNNHFAFSNIILDPNEYFIIKFLVLHSKNETPKIIPIGKIVGQKKIILEKHISSKDDLSYFQKVFNGSIWIQISRILIYLIISIVFIIMIFWLLYKIQEFRKHKLRIKYTNEFKDKSDYSKIDEVIFSKFISEGITPLKNYERILLTNNIDEIVDIYNSFLEKKHQKTEYFQDGFIQISFMIEDGLIIKDNNSLEINEHMKNTLFNFLLFLSDKKGDLEIY